MPSAEPYRGSTAELRAAARRVLGGLPGMSPMLLIVGLLACVLVPLPTVLVDLLLSLSLAGAVVLLVASLKVRRTTDILTFPSLLLLLTLFRLALNLSTTRLILSQADAGRVIDAFAGFVVRGDLVVGAVMFGIITIVQYLVIARGSERVAEVGARFALDALPGHQAAIDADLRSGVLSAREAARRRAELGERSAFHGNMDGAIKFVKGDAIAGLVITAVNLVGGLALGTGRMGYTWQESLDVYGRLTIGDGLLAQIPALLVSLAAGVIVSRVDREGGESSHRWLSPPMLVVPAVLLGGLALVPGMPTLAFATTAVALLTLALVLAGGSAAEATGPLARAPVRVLVRAADLEDPRRAARAISGLSGRCAAALGIDPPPVELLARTEGAPGGFEVRLGGRVLGRGSVSGRGTGYEDALVLEAFRAVMDHAEHLVDLQDLDAWLDRARERRPAVAATACAVAAPAEMLRLVRGLLRERIALPPFEAVLEALAQSSAFAAGSDKARWLECLREELAGYWVRDLLDALARVGAPVWIRVDPGLEDALLDAGRTEGETFVPALSPKARQAWLETVLTARGDAPALVVCGPAARAAFAALLRSVRPHVPVLSIRELERAGLEPPEDARWTPRSV